MPLTPADVHNVAFSKPPIGKRGYNEDEVDAFLDLVEAELARLIEENNDLRTQLEQVEQRLAGAHADLDDARTRTAVSPVSQPLPMRVVDEQRPLSPVPPPSAIEMTSPGGDHHVQAAKVLGLAQEMADRLTGEAKVEADSMVNEARSRAEATLNDARARAETLERQAREKASTLERDAQRKHAETLGA